MDLRAILNHCGLPSATYSHVSGGDINQAFLLTDKGRRYFLKINDAEKFPDMFVAEQDGLEALSRSTFVVPTVLKTGVANDKQYLLLEWIEPGARTAGFWRAFGESLAHLHLIAQPSFGWSRDNYIGSLVQRNDVCMDWQEFFYMHRILPLVRLLRDSGKYSAADVKAAENFCGSVRIIFPEEKPCLVHGDLWSGNFMVDPEGRPVLIDPAVYCGHREMDIGMTKLFGGFDDSFYEAYQEVFPLQKGWEERLLVSQLYPLLVHAVLFGGSYVAQTLRILRG